jgi:prevent-host-death family protein
LYNMGNTGNTSSMGMLSAAEFRASTAKALNRVAFGKERLLLGRRGEPLAALISLEDLELLRSLEDRADLAAMDEAEREGGEPVPWDALKREQGL